MVDSVEASDYIFRKIMDEYAKAQENYKRVQPQMIADLLRRCGIDAAVRTSSKFDTAEREKDEVLLRKICERKLRQYSTSRGVTKEIKSAKTLYALHQYTGEITSQYYERFKREAESHSTFTGDAVPERLKAALFTEGLNNARYGVMKMDIENRLIKRKTDLSKAYKQATKCQIPNTSEGRTTGIRHACCPRAGADTPSSRDG
jgi:hypothetical protein